MLGGIGGPISPSGGLNGGHASTGAQDTRNRFGAGDTGNIHNGGLTINGGFSFDESNPVHVGGALLIAGFVFAYLFKLLKK